MSKLKFNLLLVSLLLFLSSCNNIKVYVNNKDYADYEQFVLPTLEDFYTLNEDNYFIYLYSDSCSHCDDIKKDIFFSFIFTHKLIIFLISYLIKPSPIKVNFR